MSVPLIIIACVVSFLAVFRPNLIFSIVAAGFWLAILGVLVSDPPAFMPAGSSNQQIVIVALAGLAMGMLVHGIAMSLKSRRERNAELSYYRDDRNIGKPVPKNFSPYMTARNKQSPEIETEGDYRNRIRATRNKYATRRR